MISGYTTSDKIKLLRINKWYCVEGFSFDYETPDNANNIVISYEEVIKKLKSGVEWWCMCENGDYFTDLDTAWDDFIDEISCELDTNNSVVIEQHIELLLKGEKE